MTGRSGRPGPEVVALAIASAIEDSSTPFRVPVGQDAEMIWACEEASTIKHSKMP